MKPAAVGFDLDAVIEGALRAGLVPVWIDRHARGGGPGGVSTMTNLAGLAHLIQVPEVTAVIDDSGN